MAAPPPVPALPDTERRTQYLISASTGPLDVGFAIYGDNVDFLDWIEVYVNSQLTTAYNLTSPTGSISAIARPITDAQITFNTAQTGAVEIVGARRPRRTTQFTENQGVAARDLNQALTDIVAMQRELWDLRSRLLRGVPGDSFAVMLPATRAGTLVGFDGAGNLNLYALGQSVNLTAGAKFNTRGLAQLATIDASTQFVETAGYTSTGDGGGALYIKTGASTTGGFQSADGQWWKLALLSANPKQFGAPCNGSSDDGAFIQNAIDYLDGNFSGGDVILPPGPMAINTTVNLKARINLIGADSGTNISVLNATAHVIDVAGGGENVIRNIKFTTTLKKTAGAVIKLEISGGLVKIERVILESGVPNGAATPSFFRAVEIDSSIKWQIFSCEFNNCSDAAVQVYGTSDIGTLADTTIQWQGSLGSGGRAGLEVLQTGDYRVYNCQFEGLELGVNLTSCLLMDFFNCTADHCQIGVNIAPTTGNGVVQTRFTNCQFTSSTLSGLNVTSASGGVVNGIHLTNCLAQYNAGDGVAFTGANVSNIQIDGGQFATNTGNGINFGANVQNFTAIGTRCGDLGGAVGNGVAGITIAASCDHFIVTMNNLTTSTGVAINNAAGTSATKIVANNIS